MADDFLLFTYYNLFRMEQEIKVVFVITKHNLKKFLHMYNLLELLFTISTVNLGNFRIGCDCCCHQDHNLLELENVFF